MDFSIIYAIIYLTICFVFFGFTKDISTTYYKWKEFRGSKNSKLKLLFPAFMAIVTFGLFFAIPKTEFWFTWNYSPWWFWWIAVLGILLLWMVFLFPNYRVELPGKIHVVGAIGGISVLMIFGLSTQTWFFEIPFWVVYALMQKGKYKPKNPTLVIEVLALITIAFIFKYGYSLVDLFSLIL